MDLKTRVQMQTVVRRLEVAQVMRRIKQEKNEARKEKRPVPKEMRRKLDSQYNDAVANVRAAEAAAIAVNRFPPLTKVTQ